MNTSVTVVFLLYNAERTMPMLMQTLSRQRCDKTPQKKWLETLFVNDYSRDRTLEILERCLDEHERPQHWRVVRHQTNLGLAATLNDCFASSRRRSSDVPLRLRVRHRALRREADRAPLRSR
jgi:glycosyltransferase involved in cell wall biosynthesis